MLSVLKQNVLFDVNREFAHSIGFEIQYMKLKTSFYLAYT